MIRIKNKPTRFWNLHSHSKFSHNDALPEVSEMVRTVSGYGQRALGLTDHGNMAGSVQLYKSAMQAGIKPFPGTELYVVESRENKKAKRHHMCVVAYTTQGYKNLVEINSRAALNFYNKPLIDHSDFAEMHDAGLLKGIAATSGCFFGFIAQAVSGGDFDRARVLMKAYDSWFDRFYVELQNHNIEHDNGMTDDVLAEELMHLSDELGIPAIITQDSHYCHLEDKTVHETLKRLVSYGDGTDDAVFPGDGFHLANEKWIDEHHNEIRKEYGYEGLTDLYEAHDLSIPQLDNYAYNIPFTTTDPQRDLTARVLEAAESKNLSERYSLRIEEELRVVHDTGMAGYLILVAQVTDWCKENKVFYQARGSASGSILCWLLDITQADPIKHDLRFERFISRDRTKPPDIDLDVEHTRRQELITWLEGRFAVHQIGTWLGHSLDGDDEDGKGSLRIKYFSKARRTGHEINDWSEVPNGDKQLLRDLSDKGALSGYGVHAAGVIVTSTQSEFNKLVPLMKVASSKTYVSQYEMGDVESLGLVKLDVLGLKSLTILHKCMENLGKDVFAGLDWIPFTDASTYRMISRGETDGVFQLEGWSAKFGVKELKPTKLGDIIASMALFRKATMKTGATESYINRKHKREKVPERHEIIERTVKPTFGIFLYQEQVVTILRDLGMDADNLTAFLKAIKASNASIGDAASVIHGYREQIYGLATDAGIEEGDFNWLWTAFEGFAEYSFNKAHATAYGMTAYRCAYLVNHHPIEYFAAVLNTWAGTIKEANYIKAARMRGISIRRPDINYSGVSYEVDARGKSIRKGLLAIKGVGPKAARVIVDKRPPEGYESIEHFCRTVGTKVSGTKAFIESGDTEVGVLNVLIQAGAFRSFEDMS